MKNNGTLDLFVSSELNRPKKLIYKKDLEPINNLKILFRELRDYFAGNVTGISRDENIAKNIMRLLFSKIFDEKNKTNAEIVDFAHRPNETIDIFEKRITSIFADVKNKYPDIFDSKEKIEVYGPDLSHIVSRLELYSILNTDRDVIADAFEEFIGRSFRGGEGQFFTPRNVVQMMIDVLAPKKGDRIIDPACGSGGFLAYLLKDVLKRKIKNYFLTGIDKDLFLSKLAKIYLTLLGEDNYHIFCENSLEEPLHWKKKTLDYIELNSFDLILTNPPFGAKIPVKGYNLLNQYELGHKWNKNCNEWILTKTILDKQPPQILFIERVVQLLKPGGRAGIVLPEGIFGNPSDRYIWEYLNKYVSILGLVSLSQETFQPSTHTKTSVLFLQKKKNKSGRIFMAIANNIGHDKNGKEKYKINSKGEFLLDKNNRKIIDDDLPDITKNFIKSNNKKHKSSGRLGFFVDRKKISDNIYIPEYYNPDIVNKLSSLEKSGKYELTSIQQFIEDNILEIRRGNEIGSKFYGSGNIPFVRTSDIVNWEIKIDPIKAVNEDVYLKYKKLQDIEVNDILFVNDGTFLIGRVAIVTPLDKKIIIQSHLRKIRVLNPKIINPFYLFYLLNTSIIQEQIIAKTFVQATISTLGNRITELILPILKSKTARTKITKEMQDIINKKTDLRKRSLELLQNSI